MKATVHIVDDDVSFAKALARLLSLSDHTVETFSSVPEFLARRDPTARGCVVADLRMPGYSGFDLQSALENCENPLPVIFLTGHGDIAASVRAMKKGAEDFLTKPVRKERLLEAVKRALARDIELLARRERERDLRTRYEALTPRERQVLAFIAAGHLNKEVAVDIGATERTVKAHRANIMKKLRAGSSAELGGIAHELGISAPTSGPAK